MIFNLATIRLSPLQHILDEEDIVLLALSGEHVYINHVQVRKIMEGLYTAQWLS